MAGLSQEEFQAMKTELDQEWQRASTRDEGLQVIIRFGQRYGWKNVMSALQGRQPRRFTSGTPLDQWVEEQRGSEGDS